MAASPSAFAKRRLERPDPLFLGRAPIPSLDVRASDVILAAAASSQTPSQPPPRAPASHDLKSDEAGAGSDEVEAADPCEIRQAGVGFGEDEADPVRRTPVFSSALCSVPAPTPSSLLLVVLIREVHHLRGYQGCD